MAKTKPKTKFKKARGVKLNKSAEVRYRNALLSNVAKINALIKIHVVPLLRQNPTVLDSEDITDGIVGNVSRAFAVIQTLLNLDGSAASTRSEEFVGLIGKTANKRNSDAMTAAGFALPSVKNIIESQGIEAAVEASTAENAMLITKMSKDYIDRMQQAVLDNYMTGKFIGNGGVVKELQRISGITKNRAKLIARDQANKIHGAVTKIRSQATGSIGYEWNNVKDQRVRGNPAGKYPNVPQSRNHWDRNGKYFLWQRMNKPPLAPDGRPFRQPPIDGAPGAAINCFVGSTNIDLSNGCDKLWRRSYSGELVTLTTSDGANLQSTPNHPVMTTRGWLPVNEIKKGDYLLKRVVDGRCVADVDKNEFKTTFKDCWEAVGSVDLLSTATGSTFDFHGDGREGEVDTILLDGKLSCYGLSATLKRVANLIFSRPVTATSTPARALACDGAPDGLIGSILWCLSCRNSKKCSFLFGCVSHPDKHRLGSSAQRNIVCPENSRNNSSRNAIICGDLFDGTTFGKLIKYFRLRKIVNHIARRSFLPDDLNTSGAECLAEVVGMTPHSDAALFKCGPFLYEPICVVEKCVGIFNDTHVYNLQSVSGIYHANGIAVKNCRCFASPIWIEEDGEFF